MPSSASMKTVLVTTSILSLASQALGHMEMSWPYPLRSKYNPANSYNIIDYSMTSPLLADGSNFPCKGYQNDRPIVPTVSYTAGQTYNMTLAGSATHGGGSCQLSLSYDNGATFRVIKSMIGGCPLTSTYDFTIPSYAPGGGALLAWSWQNENGNREFYMNCAEVDIQGSSASKRDTYSTFESLPFIWKANLPGINDCVTIEGDDTVYPMPGPDVLYGGSMSSASSASSQPGQCDAATPFGQTYQYLSDTPEPQTATAESGSAATSTTALSSVSTSSKASSSVSTSSKVSTTSTQVATTLQSTIKASTSQSSKSSSTSTKVSSASTKVASTSTKIASSSTKIASSATTKSSSSTKISMTLSTVNVGKTSSSSSPTTPASTTTPAASSSTDDACGPDVTLTVYETTTSGASSVSSSVAAASASGSVVDSEYATGNLTTYLPCVPGTYICTSSTAWVTCDSTMYSDGSTAWVYRDARTLDASASCVPSFSPYSSSTKSYAQQADAPSGYYRDDRIAYTTGDSCSDDGAIECIGNNEFDLCADAVWYQMGVVASGTTCSNAELVAS